MEARGDSRHRQPAARCAAQERGFSGPIGPDNCQHPSGRELERDVGDKTGMPLGSPAEAFDVQGCRADRPAKLAKLLQSRVKGGVAHRLAPHMRDAMRAESDRAFSNRLQAPSSFPAAHPGPVERSVDGRSPGSRVNALPTFPTQGSVAYSEELAVYSCGGSHGIAS